MKVFFLLHIIASKVSLSTMMFKHLYIASINKLDGWGVLRGPIIFFLHLPKPTTRGRYIHFGFPPHFFSLVLIKFVVSTK